MLPAMKKGDTVAYDSGRLEEKQTKPPQRFTPATLLSAMKDIHKYVKDEEAKKRLRAVSGIGTEATRAAIIEDLIRRKFLKTQGKKKQLFPQPSAELFVDALPDEMTYPDKTAVWEDALHAMAAGAEDMAQFLAEQEAFARRLCATAFGTAMKRAGDHPCPRCHKGVLTKRHGKNGDFWGCTNFPHCRMTCDDKAGTPDLAGVAQRGAPRRGGDFKEGDDAYRVGAKKQSSGVPLKAAKATAQSSARTPKGAAYDASPMTEEEMAAFLTAYRPEMSARAFLAQTETPRPAWSSAPKASAAALEDMTQKATPSDPPCPTCGEGHLRLLHGRNGDFWGCSRYPQCTATYDDRQGKPAL